MSDDPTVVDLPKSTSAEYRRGVLDGWNLAAECAAEGHPLHPVLPPEATQETP
jgi:hypothetical protein